MVLVNSNSNSSSVEPDAPVTEQDCDVGIEHGMGQQTRSVDEDNTAGDWGECTFVGCEEGYIKNTQNRSCDIPSTGNYANAQGAEQACEGLPQYATWAANGGPVSSANACAFTCAEGSMENGPARTCDLPTKGYYVNAQGGEQACTNLPAHSTWADSTEPVASDSCPFDCGSGYIKIKDGQSRACNFPSKGHYVDVNWVERACTNAPAHSTWAANVSPLASDNCPFTCAEGSVKNGPARTCDLPTKGNYFNTQGTGQTCTNLPAHSTWADSTEPVASDSCPFHCSSGYVKDGQSRACNLPSKGHYADANGVEKGCTGGPPQHAEWLENTRPLDTDDCLSACRAGYWKDGANCVITPEGEWSAAKSNTKQSCNPLPVNAVYTHQGETSVNCRTACAPAHQKNSRGACVALQSRSCATYISYGTATGTQNYNALTEAWDGACNISRCDVDYYKPTSTNDCEVVGAGYYSVGTGTSSLERVQCNSGNSGAVTNGPIY